MLADTPPPDIEPLIFLATCQPHLKQCDGPRHQTTLLTLEEKRAFVDEMDTRRTGFIPATIDHAGGEREGGAGAPSGRFEVAGQLQIGRFVDALLGPKGELVMVGEVWHDRPEAAMIANDIRSGRNDPAAGHRPWGTSLCTNLAMDADLTTVHAKRVTHIGITRDPEFGPEGTHVHLAASNWPAFYRRLKTDFLDKDAGWYVPPTLRRRIAAAVSAAPPPATATVTVDVGASRLLPAAPSEAGARLPRAETRTTAVTFLPPSFASRSSSSSSSSMATPTNTSSTATDAAVQQQERQTHLERVHREMEAFVADVSPKDKEMQTDVAYDAERLVRAKKLIDAYSGLLEGVAPNQWGGDMYDRFAVLNGYITNAQREANKFIDDTYKPVISADEVARYKQAIQDPMSAGHYPTAVQVFATRSMSITNQRSMEARLMQVNVENEKQKAEIAAERDALKKKRDEWEKERVELQSRVDDLGKRQRTDAPAAAAAGNNANTFSTPAVSSFGGSPVSIDVGASNRLPPFLPRARVVSSSAFLESLTPTHFNQATVNSMTASQFMTPWRDSDTDQGKWLKERLGKYRL